MQVKEIEQLLNISKDNLRYYESEGLIFPARKLYKTNAGLN